MQAFRALFLECMALPLARFLAKPKLNIHARIGRAGPVLIVANHVTSYDAPLILLALPGRIRRRVAIAMSAEMLLDFRRGRNQGNWFLNLLAPIAYLLMTGPVQCFSAPASDRLPAQFRARGSSRRPRLQRACVSGRTPLRRWRSAALQRRGRSAVERVRNRRPSRASQRFGRNQSPTGQVVSYRHDFRFGRRSSPRRPLNLRPT